MNSKLIIFFIAVIIALFVYNEFSPKTIAQQERGAVTVSETKTTGEAAIGGTFELTDQNGNKFTDANLVGKFSMIYFGFTNCPHICPLALSNMTLALNELGDKAKDFQIIFITVDPKNDTTARLKEFLANFNAPVIGLTGTDAQLEKANAAYKVYAEKLQADNKGAYNMNHTSIIYIMDKDGKFIDHMNHESKVADMVTKLKTID